MYASMRWLVALGCSVGTGSEWVWVVSGFQVTGRFQVASEFQVAGGFEIASGFG